MPDLAQWQQMWARLGVTTPDASVFDRLVASYSEPHRKYHTTRHLDECLARFEELRTEAKHPEEVELALWFHDAIYDTRRQDNEARSAEWARATATAANLPADAAERISKLILATRHDAVPQDSDEKVLIDVDLSILGEKPDRFDEYENQIREEYAWVPTLVFRAKRRDVLKGFLARASIFKRSPLGSGLARAVAQISFCSRSDGDVSVLVTREAEQQRDAQG
jgi:predicted metal-dependent HD superfamily phosphohydrolase